MVWNIWIIFPQKLVRFSSQLSFIFFRWVGIPPTRTYQYAYDMYDIYMVIDIYMIWWFHDLNSGYGINMYGYHDLGGNHSENLYEYR